MDTSRFAGHDGQQLAFRETGSGRPLIALHGFMGTGASWLERGPGDVLAGHAVVAGQGLAKVSGPQGGGASQRGLTALVASRAAARRRYARVPGDHGGSFATPEFAAVLTEFLTDQSDHSNQAD